MRLRSLRLANLATSVILCRFTDFVFSRFGFRAGYGGHSTLFVLPALNDGMAEYALKTEHHLIDIGDAHEPDLALPTSGFQVRRLRATREVGKARGSLRR